MTTQQPIGARIKRNEDPRLLTGRALFVDDVELPGMVHVAFLRSPYAHARILGVDVREARRREGVVAVYTAEDLGDYWQHGPLLVPPPPVEGWCSTSARQVPLAQGQGAPCGRADRRGRGRLAATSPRTRSTDIVVDYEPLPAVVDLEKALAPGAPLVHEDVGSNLAATCCRTRGTTTAARAQADVVISRRFHYDRGAAAAIENRGVVAQWDARGPAADDLGHHPGADPGAQRPGRACSASPSTRCGWWRRSSAAASAPRS